MLADVQITYISHEVGHFDFSRIWDQVWVGEVGFSLYGLYINQKNVLLASQAQGRQRASIELCREQAKQTNVTQVYHCPRLFFHSKQTFQLLRFETKGSGHSRLLGKFSPAYTHHWSTSGLERVSVCGHINLFRQMLLADRTACI